VIKRSDVTEKDYLRECPDEDCEVEFIGATPEDVRAHAVEEHSPLWDCFVFTEEIDE